MWSRRSNRLLERSFGDGMDQMRGDGMDQMSIRGDDMDERWRWIGGHEMDKMRWIR